jgi:hypothetical protein
VTRFAATRASEAADALLGWLDSQPRQSFQRPPEAPPALVAPALPDAPTVQPRFRREVDPGKARHLAHTDWLHHRLIVSGPVVDVATFRAAAAGAGTIPWHLDLDRLEEDWFHLLVSPPPPQQRTLSVAGARVLAGQLRAAVSRRHALAVARAGQSQACPFDLHALGPVPQAVLRLGSDDPESRDWLWAKWGTTQALRHVVAPSRQDGQLPDPAPDGIAANGDDTAFHLTFWSADWTPWRAFAHMAARWPTLRFDVRPTYGVL